MAGPRAKGTISEFRGTKSSRDFPFSKTRKPPQKLTPPFRTVAIRPVCGAWAARRGGEQGHWGAQAQGMTHTGPCARGQPQRRRSRGVVLVGRSILTGASFWSPLAVPQLPLARVFAAPDHCGPSGWCKGQSGRREGAQRRTRLGAAWVGLFWGPLLGVLGRRVGGVADWRQGQELQGCEGYTSALTRKQFLAAKSCCTRLLARVCGCTRIWSRHEARALGRPRRRLSEYDT